MGWLYYRIHHTPKEELRRIVEDERYDGTPSPFRLLDVAIVAMREAYMAVVDTRDQKVRAWTFLVDLRTGKDGLNFGYKDMAEDWGPSMGRCPKRILERLSPVEDCYPTGVGRDAAAWWREGNWREIRRRDTLSALKDGDRIRFETPFSFASGFKCDTFTVRRRGRQRVFLAEDGSVCVLRGLHGTPFTRLCAHP